VERQVRYVVEIYNDFVEDVVRGSKGVDRITPKEGMEYLQEWVESDNITRLVTSAENGAIGNGL